MAEAQPLVPSSDKAWKEKCHELIEHGFFDLLPDDPPHFTFGRRG
jgi:hypothetical protein